APVSASPISAQPNNALRCSGISCWVMNQKAMAESTPETMTPLYRAAMILPLPPTRTKYVPMIEEMMEGAECQRIDRRVGAAGEGQSAEQHGRDDRDGVGFEQVRGHAGTVTDVVTDVVGDDAGIAGVVLGNTRLNLADEVRAHVRSLGEDAAAQAREDRDQRAAKRQTHQRMQRCVLGHEATQDHVVDAD